MTADDLKRLKEKIDILRLTSGHAWSSARDGTAEDTASLFDDAFNIAADVLSELLAAQPIRTPLDAMPAPDDPGPMP